MKNFWEKLNKPIYALAPMAGYTDSAFRQICAEMGADVLYSEMASVNALIYNPKKTLEMLYFTKKERLYIVQLFGSKPEHFARAAELLSGRLKINKILNLKSNRPAGKAGILNPDGIDINLGCPVKKVLKQGAGSALMANLKLAREVIKSTIESTDLPVSIKIRAKSGDVNALKFLDYIGDLDIKAVMIHGRTLSQGFAGPIDTAIIKKARHYFRGVILANGGIICPEDAKRVLSETKADGVGIAQGAIGNPWIFLKSKILNLKSKNAIDGRSIPNIIKVINKHAQLAYKIKGERGIIEMRAHLCSYINGLPGARKLREEMVKVKSLEDIKRVLRGLKE